MIYVNGNLVDVKHFPDGTQMLFNAGIKDIIGVQYSPETRWLNFKWIYENDEELVTLIYLVKHYRENMPSPYKRMIAYRLIMQYIPNARMDRTKEDNEVFTLKYFADIINSLEFDEIIALDPHSDVSKAMINNLRIEPVEPYINYTLDDIEGKDIDGGVKYGGKTIIYFPDAGAMKRYRKLDVFTGREIIYGQKERDWKTGKIMGLSIFTEGGTPLVDFGEEPLKDKVVLMIDDIVSYGGTLAYSADSLKKLGASAIYAYVSHTENSVLDEEKGTLLKRLNEGVVDELFTTPSLYFGIHPRIKVIDEL